MPARTIAIGDIHGCAAEFAELLARLEPTRDDRLILLGDLINKGPDNCAVIDLARRHNAISLLGNHELRLLNHRHLENPKFANAADKRTFHELRTTDWEYLERMPLTFFAPEYDTVFVHAGFLPNENWQKQHATTVTRIQVIDPDGRPRKRVDSPKSPHWTTFWNHAPRVVYGHTPNPEIIRTEWTTCLDTACVSGGSLSALIFPGEKILQVKARKNYAR